MKKPPLLGKGHVLIFTITVLGIIFALTGIILVLVQYENYSSQRSYISKQALNLSEAGVDLAVRELNANGNYSGETFTLGQGEITITVSGSGSNRTIEATTYIPNSTNPRAQRTVRAQAQIDSEEVEFFYGIQVGGGGLSMQNSTRVNGNVYSNGNITGNNTPVITGDVVVAGGLSDNPAVEHASHNSDQYFATSSSNRDIAQSFHATAAGTLPKVSVFLAKVGNPTNNLTVRIATDVAGRPNTSSLASSTIPSPTIGTTASWIDVTFNSPATLTNGTKYWIVLDYSTNNATNHWNWRKDNTDSYVNNTGRYTSNCCSGSPTWTDVGGDLAFRVWIGGTVTGIRGPITIGSASSGTGRANEFVNTNGNVVIHGSNCPNQYCIVENPPAQALPISDGVVTDWKNDAAAGGTQTGNYYLSGTQTASLGPKKIIGDMFLSNSSILTLTGTVWVTGNVYVSNDSTLKLDSSYGPNSGLMVSDGVYTISNEVQIQGSGSNGSYIMLLTDRNATSQVSIYVSNASTAVIYYSGKSLIQFSNEAQAKEATAWGITMSNSATVTYESGLQNASFTSGPGGGWAIKPGSWQEIR